MQKGTPTSDCIGGYRVLEQLSVMGSVQVHLAREEAAGESSPNVVLKILPKASGGEARDAQEIVREATACTRLTHPGIVRTRQAFEHDNAVVLVLEYVDGISLADLLARRVDGNTPLPLQAALLIGLSICDALAHAHGMLNQKRVPAPIVHRAVNPSNILIGRDGFVKLDGFGFAKILGGVATHTAEGAVWTPAYLAPEQTTTEPPTPKVDVYAAGLILWELLTGRSATILPHDPLAIDATLKAVAARNPEPLATLRPDIAPELASAVDAALRPASENRTIACAEIARAIRKVFHFAQGKLQLRERVTAALAAAASDRESAQRSQPTVARAEPAGLAFAKTMTAPNEPIGLGFTKTVVASNEPAVAFAKTVMASNEPAGAFAKTVAVHSNHRTLVGLAPPGPAAPAPPRETSSAEIPLPALPPPLPASALAFASVCSPSPEQSMARQSASREHAPAVASLDPLAISPESNARSADRTVPGALEWASIVGRLHAPTPWRRSPWLVAWVGLSLSLVGLVGKLSFSRASTASAVRASHAISSEVAAAAIAAPTPAVAPPPMETIAPPAHSPAPPPIEVPDPTPAIAAAEEQPVASTPPAPDDPATMQQMLRRGLSYLTIHSTATRADVYVDLRSYGSVEDKLSVPCGKHFISIGRPARPPAKTIWLAPGKSMFIPCGKSFEAAMNPRALR
jgi:eukaryotic-like serine/threonine-protein kinase